VWWSSLQPSSPFHRRIRFRRAPTRAPSSRHRWTMVYVRAFGRRCGMTLNTASWPDLRCGRGRLGRAQSEANQFTGIERLTPLRTQLQVRRRSAVSVRDARPVLLWRRSRQCDIQVSRETWERRDNGPQGGGLINLQPNRLVANLLVPRLRKVRGPRAAQAKAPCELSEQAIEPPCP
jgi:hypothetical protein